MLELLLAIGVIGLLAVVGFKLMFAALGALLWLIALPFRVVGAIIVLPFKILGCVLGLVLTVVLLPLLFVGMLILGLGLGAAFGLAGLVMLPLAVLALPLLILIWALRPKPARPASSATA